jgi:hypothetical protein
MNRFAALSAALLLAACQEAPARGAAAAESRPTAPVVTPVDSVIPIPVALARFRVDIPQALEGLHGGAPSRDSLVSALVGALARRDAPALEALTVGRAEYAYLYYPTTRISKPPYELPPGLAWFRLQEADRKGALRALRTLGGPGLRLLGYSCDGSPADEGENRVWSGCMVDLRKPDGSETRVRLFGAILERAGRFKVLSFENDF